MKREKQIRTASHSREPNFTLEQHWLQWSKCSLEEESICLWILKEVGRKMVQYRSEREKRSGIKDGTEHVIIK